MEMRYSTSKQEQVGRDEPGVYVCVCVYVCAGMHNEEERVSVLGASSAPDDYSK